MIDFKPLELSDKSWIDPLVMAENSLSADFNFGNLFMWDMNFCQQVANVGNRLVVMPTCAKHPYFAYPVGSGQLGQAIEEMRAFTKEKGLPLVIHGVTPEHIGEMEALFPGKFEFTSDREYWDYIYSAEKLSTLAGKKLHGKRNHINRFLKENPDWRYEALTPELIPECLAMLDEWTGRMPASEAAGLKAEHTAIVRGFENFEALGLEGGVLRVTGKVSAFTVGEMISSNGFNVHFEKAYAEINGAYPMINREFVRQTVERHPQVEYINREDDMGHDNLRQAKLSYFPEMMVEKHSARWKE